MVILGSAASLACLLLTSAVWWACVGRERAERHDRRGNVKIALWMIQTWADTHDGRLPPPEAMAAGARKPSSWRYSVFANFRGTREAREWAETVGVGPPEFCYPGSRRTCVLGVRGDGTAFDRRVELRLGDMPNDCILIVEVKDSSFDWAEPGDCDASRVSPSSRYKSGFHVGFVDGQVWFVRNDVPLELLRRFVSIEGARQNDRDLLIEYRIE
jgi:hypothetical protein